MNWLQQDQAERWPRLTIATLRLVFGLGILAALFASTLFNEAVPLSGTGAYVAMVLIVSGGVSLLSLTRSMAVQTMLAVVDVAALSALILSFGALYPGMPAASVSAPTFSFFFLLLAAHALWRRWWLVCLLTVLMVAIWLALLVGLVEGGAQVSFSYTHWMRAPAILPLAEVEKLVALALTGAVLVVGIFLARDRQAVAEQPDPAPPPALMAEPSGPFTRRPGIGPIRVLAAEDAHVNVLVLQQSLPAPTFDLTVVEDGEEVVDRFADALAREAPPTVVLMDIELPLKSGIDAIRDIRALEREAGVGPTPIIAVSALAEYSAAESIVAGADEYLSKPVTQEMLLLAILRSLRLGPDQGEPAVV